MINSAPSFIKLHRKSCELEVAFGSTHYRLPAEYLRVFSPSAEVKGHGADEEVLQLNKQNVAITGIQPQGNYAIKLIYSDGHDSGIYAWHYLQELGENHLANWQDYLKRVETHNAQAAEQEANKHVSTIKWVDPK